MDTVIYDGLEKKMDISIKNQRKYQESKKVSKIEESINKYGEK